MKTDKTTILPFENYLAMPHPEILNISTNVESNMVLHVDIFSDPPVPMTEMKSNNETYAALIAESADGSKKIIARRDKQSIVVIKDLRLLSRYADKVANGDIATFKLSGFEPALSVRSPRLVLSRNLRKLVHGVISGQVLVYLNAIINALSYELRYAVVSNGLPGEWTYQIATGVKKPVVLNGLTPGATYAFQVRSMDKATGYSDWSDSVTFISI